MKDAYHNGNTRARSGSVKTRENTNPSNGLRERKSGTRPFLHSIQRVAAAEPEPADRLLMSIYKGTASATGEDFFCALVQHLADALRVRYAFVSEFIADTDRIRTLAFWVNDHLADNIEYDVAGTPCEKVMEGQICEYRHGVQELFPDDKDLVELNAESYIAIPLLTPDGRVLGHLAVLHDEPKSARPRDMSAFKVFASRASAEIERKRAENELWDAYAQLIQWEKLAGLGRLTAGIVHELNTPIGVIQSSSDTSMRAINKIEQMHYDDRKLRNYLSVLKENNQATQKSSSRVARIMASLKNFTHLDESECQKTDLHEGIESTVMLLQDKIGNIQLAKEFGDIPPVTCCPGEINQVFMTLLTNATEAVESNGQIRVKTWSDEKNVFIAISDTGRGMAPVQLKSLFELGFAKKGARMGVGFGLSNSYNIVKKHGGDLRVESEIGKGTEFMITLPITMS